MDGIREKDNTPGNDIVSSASRLLDVSDVARVLNCSKQHVRRLADAGRMPRPVKLGALIRWNRAEIETWLAAGCPDARKRSMAHAVRVAT
jgi:excisionase family DNA binding protein